MTEIDAQPQPGTLEHVVPSRSSSRGLSGLDADVTAVRHTLRQRAAKRTADVVIVLILAPIALVVTAVVAMLIVLVDRQNPFFVDERVGYGGRRFGCLKLRTMRTDDGAFDAYLSDHEDESLRWLESRKVGCDPRVTKFGALLRRSSIDEVPQLLNVVIGSMSLIGPRPLSEREFLARPERSQRLLEHARPGVTGLWQVSGRCNVPNADRVALDDEYVVGWSIRGDLRILARTPTSVLAGSGAK